MIALVLILPLLCDASSLTHVEHVFRNQEVSKDLQHNVTIVRQIRKSQPLHLDEWAALTRTESAPDVVLSNDQPGAYWDFLPDYFGAAVPGLPDVTFETPCFKNVAVAATYAEGKAKVVFTATGAKKLLCHDFYLLTTIKSFHVEEVISVSLSHKHTIEWSGFDNDEVIDVQTSGFRIFRFSMSIMSIAESLWETALLFLEPQVSAKVTTAAAERNIKFLKEYATHALGTHFGEKRSITDVIPSEDEIGDGDLFCILRFDGLDPLINWGTGGNCGHNVMALRIDGELQIIESQSQSAYWPKNYVQRNSFADWIDMARKADYNVLHIRLSEASRARFNASAAAEAFEGTHEGLLYGFETLLWGWFDLGNPNLPTPLDMHLVATLFAILDPLLTKALGTTPSLWNNAMAQRLGASDGSGDVTFGMTTQDLFAVAEARNLSMTDLVEMPESDAYVYPRPGGSCARKAGCTGPSSVCNVFVCRMWKAGGLFDADFNCGEQVPLDTYEMDIFDKSPQLSAACRAADPMFTQYCQILGKYRLELPRFSSVKPFTGMRERCPSKGPAYSSRFSADVDGSC